MNLAFAPDIFICKFIPAGALCVMEPLELGLGVRQLNYRGLYDRGAIGRTVCALGGLLTRHFPSLFLAHDRSL